jgi:purine-binding chemotaxis protein CheW
MIATDSDDMSDYLDALLGEVHASVPAPTSVGAVAVAVAPAPTPAPAPASIEPSPSVMSRPIAIAPSTTPVATSSRWLRVLVGGASYALELLRVQEVVRLVPIVAMRGAQPAVLGAMNLRGRIVPVFDLGLWLRTGQVEAGDQSRIVVVERDDELIGLLVSAVEDVVTLGRDRIEPPLAGHAPGMVLGVARVGASPTVLFDAYALYG